MMDELLNAISACQICAEHLPNAPRPVVRAHAESRLLIIGHAPGAKVQASGIAWDDASGARLRDWMSVTEDQFYGDKVGIVPMGFCYPGTGTSGDMPPRPECAPKWHAALLGQMPKIEMTLLIGHYAQSYYLADKEKTLTATVQQFARWLPEYLPLPHPSPRNNRWLKNNPWFDQQVLPELRARVVEMNL